MIAVLTLNMCAFIVGLTRVFRSRRVGFSARVVIPCLVVSTLLFSCDNGESGEPEPVVVDLVSPLTEELHPLGLDPLQWTDDDIHASASFSGKSIVALGEATHGTAEFFDAKHRIFRHLVEKQGFKVFAIEADFGESVILNKAIQESRTSDIKPLMLSTMLFWTWKTAEVQAMLEWMSEYNRGKPAEDKLQYMGVDCQANVNNAPLVFDYLQSADMPFLSWADSLLEVSKTATLYNFKFHTEESFIAYNKELSSLQDSISHYKSALTVNRTEQDYQLLVHLVEVIRQTSEVSFNYTRHSADNNRDRYMAENVLWLREYFPAAKVVIWAHNVHISNDRDFSSMGFYLKGQLDDDYHMLGFLFSKGSFNAIGISGANYLPLAARAIIEEPKANSVNAIFSSANEPVFSIALSDLNNHPEWVSAFSDGLEFFHFGSVFGTTPDYFPFKRTHYDQIIYFDQTNAATILSP